MPDGDGNASRVRNFSPWASWQLALESTELELPIPLDDDGIPGWRARVRAELTELLGDFPQQVPLALEQLDSVDCGAYRRDRVVFDVEPTMSVPAYLLVPKDRSAPGSAVLAVHGHGPGKDAVCGLAETPEHGAYAHELAERGHIVLAPDLRCFGERADWQPEDRYHCDLNLVHAVMTGTNPLTQNLHDLACALDVLEQHPLVDEERMSVVGISYGGTMSLFLAAWDARVRAAVVSGYFSSWRAAHRVPWNMCGSQVLWGMLGHVEHVDVAALVAPRPLLIESGTEDLIFPVDAARASFAQLERVYRAFKAPRGALQHDVFEGGHEWHGAEAYAFLDRWL
jgi:dienelactone hydrolase